MRMPKRRAPIAVCAACGGDIEHIDHGWVEWIERGETLLGFRVVHHGGALGGGCTRDGNTPGLRDMHLSHFVGARGLMRLSKRLSLSTFTGSSVSRVLDVVARSIVCGYEPDGWFEEADWERQRKRHKAWKARFYAAADVDVVLPGYNTAHASGGLRVDDEVMSDAESSEMLAKLERGEY